MQTSLILPDLYEKGTEAPLTLTLSRQGRGDLLGRLSACLTPSPLTEDGWGEGDPSINKL